MLRIANHNRRPGNGYFYVCPENGQRAHARNWPGLITKALKLRRKYRLHIPVGFDEIVEHNWCVDHPEYCHDPDAAASSRKMVALEEVPTPRQQIPYPPLSEQVKSFVGGMAEWIASGGRRSDFNEVTRRLDICTQCEFWNGGSSFLSFRCRKCGCRLKIKAAMRTMKCPIGRW